MGVSGSLFLLVWAAAMAAMMLPSELPLFRLAHATTQSTVQTGALVAGYAAVWLVVGLAAMALPELPAAIVLGGAAIFQLTPLKRRCLDVCRSPLARVLHGWREGRAGAFRMGVENACWCLGCCAGLTLVLVALGMTNVVWLAVVGAAIYAEKATRAGILASRVVALVLAIGAVAWAM
jgi:predicted metal-binding membrane protein